MNNLGFNEIISLLGQNASPDMIIAALREVEPLARGFYAVCSDEVCVYMADEICRSP